MSFYLRHQFVLIIIFASIAVLFPKYFYPMLMNQESPTPIENRYVGPKQERPVYLRPETIHLAMRERGSQFPPHPTVPIVEKSGGPMVPGVPGAGIKTAGLGADKQAKQTSSINSVIMPIYTLGIVAFFIYTLVKVFLKNSSKDSLPKESDPVFAQKVFGDSKADKKNANPKLVYNCIQSIIEQTEKELLEAKSEVEKIKEDTSQIVEGDLLPSAEAKENGEEGDVKVCNGISESADKEETNESKSESVPAVNGTSHDHETEIRLKNLMECCSIKAVTNDDNSDTKAIYLEGELPHDSQILVSASETTTEKAPHENDNDENDEDIILSGKMTISLISLSHDDVKEKAAVVESAVVKTESANVTCA